MALEPPVSQSPGFINKNADSWACVRRSESHCVTGSQFCRGIASRCWACFLNVSCSDPSQFLPVATHPSRHQSAGAAGHSPTGKWTLQVFHCFQLLSSRAASPRLSTLPCVTLNTLFASLFLGSLIWENGVNNTAYLRVVGDRVHHEHCAQDSSY